MSSYSFGNDAVKDSEPCPSAKPVSISPAFADTITNVSDEWSKEVPFGSLAKDYPWALNGLPKENRLILTPDVPLGKGCPSLVWECKSLKGRADGGYVSPIYTIDPAKKYRYVTFMKKYKTANGRTYHGTYGYDSKNKNIGLLNRSTLKVNKNAYFWSGDLPELNEWFLVVGYVHPIGTPASKINEGGIYKLGNAKKIKPTIDFIFAKGNTKTRIRDYLYYTSLDNVKQRMFLPSIQVVDGNEMPIEILLGL